MTGPRLGSGRIPRVLAAAGAAGVMALATAGVAGAEPPDPCSPAAMMRAHAAAMTQMADYLDSHPDVAQVFSDARREATPQARRDMIKTYTDSHPEVADAMRSIHQPVQDLGTRCGMPMQPGMHGDMGPGMMGPDQDMGPGMMMPGQ
ncbi:hemophore-related protein [Mycobacterium sp. ACS4331]|uniref:hemophore-related protein n=1 Tax=Mycobacterium sp. ACS4331 TaxID=1834121 RepID=UPI0008017B27|nr:hemophore-related protein [Mycobacterium sp. ACS4331]OBF13702.1 hypothetical protein A5727_16720 [Mycobacterium sp. ACS4331]